MTNSSESSFSSSSFELFTCLLSIKRALSHLVVMSHVGIVLKLDPNETDAPVQCVGSDEASVSIRNAHKISFGLLLTKPNY